MSNTLSLTFVEVTHVQFSFCFVSTGEGLHVLHSNQYDQLERCFESAAAGKLTSKQVKHQSSKFKSSPNPSLEWDSASCAQSMIISSPSISSSSTTINQTQSLNINPYLQTYDVPRNCSSFRETFRDTRSSASSVSSDSCISAKTAASITTIDMDKQPQNILNISHYENCQVLLQQLQQSLYHHHI